MMPDRPETPSQQPTRAPDPSPTADTRLIAQSSVVSSTQVSTASVLGGRDVERLGHYRIERELGRGGMGVVYKAFDEQLDRYVAIKVISPDYASLPGCVERLRVEARAAARIVHQNIISVHAFAEDKGLHYIVLEYVEGMDLAEKLRREGLVPLAKALGYTRDAAVALKFAAEHHVIHRDIKPSNIFITRAEHAKVMDFGLAKRLDVDSSLTVSGAIIGTPSYMSPEQGAGAELDVRSDIYSLGCTLFTILAGKKPFEGRTPIEVLMQHTTQPLPIPPEWKKSFGQPFIDFLLKMTAKKPEDRHQTWQEVVDHIDGLRNGTAPVAAPVTTQRRAGNKFTIPAIVAVVAVAFIGGTYISGIGRGGEQVVRGGTTTVLATPAATPVPTPAPTPVPTPALTPIPTLAVEDSGSRPPDPNRSGQFHPPGIAEIIDARELAKQIQFVEAATALQSAAVVPHVLQPYVGEEFILVREGLGIAHKVSGELTTMGIIDHGQRDSYLFDVIRTPENSKNPLVTRQTALLYITAVDSPRGEEAISLYRQVESGVQQDPKFIARMEALTVFHGWVMGQPPSRFSISGTDQGDQPRGGERQPPLRRPGGRPRIVPRQ